MAKRILVTEDEQALADALTHRLTKEGYEVTHAADGEDALTKLRAEKFDALLLDLLMPKKDGFAVLKELEPEHRPGYIMVLSNLNEDARVQELHGLGMKDFAIKAETPLATISEKLKTALGA